MTDASSQPTIDIESLGLDQGAHLLIKRALDRLDDAQTLGVYGASPDWDLHLAAWCRQQGHGLRFERAVDGRLMAWIQRARQHGGRWVGALATGHSDASAPGAVQDEAQPAWGLAARGAQVEAGGPAIPFGLRRKHELWAATAGELYRQAVAAQWDPDTAIDWQSPFELAHDIEAAVVQVMTYLIENENAALIVPARHLGQVHPHFREVMQLLAIQCADEARHVEVFTRRATLKGRPPALSTGGGQRSLGTLLQAGDFSIGMLLLSVLGEGSFVNLLQFLQAHGPDPVTRQVAWLAARDEARHVAFGMAHLEYRLSVEPEFRATLAGAIEQRFDELASSAGLNEEVFDALVLLAAGDDTPAAIREGFAQVRALKRDMATGRRARLTRLGFSVEQARRLADLHTRNFM